MRRLCIYILLILHVFFTGNIGIVVDNYFSIASAASTTWDFSTPGDYTLSSSTDINIVNNTAKLKSTLSQVGRLNNGPTLLEQATDVVVSGNYAYITSYGSNAIEIINISNPASPSHTYNLTMSNTQKLYGAYDLIIKGNYLYVASYVDDDIEIIDISTPTAAFHVTNIANNASRKLNGPRGLDISGDYLYVASYTDDALQIIDISTPTAPVSRGFLKNTTRLDGATGIKIDGNYAYVTSYLKDNLQVIDITDPDNPAFFGQLLDNTGGSRLRRPRGIDIKGNYAYIASYTDDTLEIVDITNPSTPIHFGHVRNTVAGTRLNGPRDVKISGNYIYITSFVDDAIQIIDISNPAIPVVNGNLRDTIRLNGASGIYISGNNAYVAVSDGASFQVIDITNKNSLSFNSELTSGPVKTGGAVNIIYDGGYAYIASYLSHSIEIVDVSDKTNPTHVAEISATNTDKLRGAYDLEKVGNYLYVASYIDDSLSIIDVTTPASPIYVSKVTHSNGNRELNGARGISIEDNFAYITSYNSDAIQVIDVSNPNIPVAKGFIKDATRLDGVVDIKIKGNYAYTTSYKKSSIQVINISDPDNLVFVNEILNSASIEEQGGWGVEIDGDFLYISAYTDDGVQIYDISDGANPLALGNITNSTPVKLNGAKNSIIDQGYMYVASYNDDSVQILDISDSSNISNINYYRDTLNMNGVSGIAKNNNLIFTANYLQGSLEILEENYISSSPFIIPTTNISSDFISSISIGTGSYNQGNTTFQLSKDNGTTWNYYNGSIWVPTAAGTAQSNDISTINSNIYGFNTLPGGTDQIKWKAFLNSDGTEKVELSYIEISTTPPVLTFTQTTDNNWGSGFCYAFEVENVSNLPITNWEIGLSLSGGTLSSNWGADMTDTGGSIFEVTSDSAQNEVIDPGEKFTVGFCGNGIAVTYPSDISLDYYEPISGGVLQDYTVEANGMRVEVTTGSSGGSNYCRNIDITNIGTNIIIDWEVNFELDQALASSFSAIYNQTGITYTITPLAFNSTINIGSTITTGFCTNGPNVDSSWSIGAISSNGTGDTTPPVISSTSPIDEENVTGPSLNLEFDYTDELTGSGIDLSSDNVFLYEWDGFNWGADIASTYIGSGSISSTGAIYPVSGIQTGRYKVNFNISDLALNLSSTGFIMNVTTVVTGDTTAPIISGTNFASGSLLPGGNHNVVINYSDIESGINTSSDSITLHKWNGSIWSADISATGLDFGSKVITATSATYPTNNLDFGKYRYNFTITDNDGNTSSTLLNIFYIDIPEFIVSTPEIDLGVLNHLSNTFSPTVTITVKTVGSAFTVNMNRSSNFTEGTETIPSWDSSLGYGYQQSPFTSTIDTIGVNQVVASQGASINTDGNKNTYTFDIQIGAIVDEFQSTGDYLGSLDFALGLTY